MLEQICQLARDAGATIMAVYQGDQPLALAYKGMNLRLRQPIWRRMRSSKRDYCA